MSIENGIFGNIENLEQIPEEKWKRKCDICGRIEGICISCSENRCNSAFHVTCAWTSRYCMERKENEEVSIYSSYCPIHAPKRPKKSGTSIYKIDDGTERKRRSSNKKKFLDVFSHGTISLEDAEKVIRKAPVHSIQKVWKFWLDKRKSRSGNPLLKRLSKNILFGPRQMPTPRRHGADVIDPYEELNRMYVLRRDLERCRILLELIKKR